jgi:hypothetical protein
LEIAEGDIAHAEDPSTAEAAYKDSFTALEPRFANDAKNMAGAIDGLLMRARSDTVQSRAQAAERKLAHYLATAPNVPAPLADVDPKSFRVFDNGDSRYVSYRHKDGRAGRSDEPTSQALCGILKSDKLLANVAVGIANNQGALLLAANEALENLPVDRVAAWAHEFFAPFEAMSKEEAHLARLMLQGYLAPLDSSDAAVGMARQTLARLTEIADGTPHAASR